MEKLRSEKRWSVWKRTTNDSKHFIVPFFSLAQRSSASDPSNWIYFSAAKQLQSNHPDEVAGIGFFLAPLKDPCTLSLCEITLGQSDVAEGILSQFNGTYEEVSQKGKIHRIFCYVNVSGLNASGYDAGMFPVRNLEKQITVHLGIHSKHFAVCSGNVVSPDNVITDQTMNVLWLLGHYMEDPDECGPWIITAPTINVQERLTAARQSEKGTEFSQLYDQGDTSSYNDKDAANKALVDMLCYWLTPADGDLIDQAFRDSALYHQDEWEKTIEDTTYGKKIIQNAVDECVTFYLPENEQLYATPISDGWPVGSEIKFISFDEDIRTPDDALRRLQEKRAASPSIGALLETSNIIKTTDKGIAEQLQSQLEACLRNEHTDPLVADVYRELLETVRSKDISRHIMDIFNDAIQSSEYTGKVTVLPIMCGIGKSTAISHKIFDTLSRNDTDGLLIITDRVDRINEYIDQHERYPKMTAFFNAHRNDICLLSAETMAEELPKQQYCKVLLMTTQHFYNLPLDEVRGLTTWGSENNLYPRSLVLFDEDPEVASVFEIKMSDMDEVATAIREGLPASPDFRERKDLCIKFWEKIREAFKDVSDRMDREYQGKAFYFFQTFSLPDKFLVDRFLDLVEEHKDRINSYRNDPDDSVDTLIKKTLKLMKSNVLVCARDDSSNQKTSFSFLLDNAPHIRALVSDRTHVFILDGTADVSPNYDLHPDLYYRADSPIDRDLDILHIHAVDMKCGASTLRKMKTDKRKELVSSVVELAQKYDVHDNKKPAVFTYKSVESYFYRAFGKEYVAHFKNIAGRNEFRELSVIIQVGLNHFSPEKHILFHMATDPTFRDELLEKSHEEQHKVIQHEGKTKTSLTWAFLYRVILADIEQNLFRGKIRNYDVLSDVLGQEAGASRKEYHYVICYSFSYYPQLFQMLKDRFEPHNADVSIREKDLAQVIREHFARLTSEGYEYKETNVCKFINDLRKLNPDTVYSSSDLKTEMQLSDTQYKNIIKIKLVAAVLKQITVKRGQYRVGNLFSQPEMKDL